jgi:hypothetical protein
MTTKIHSAELAGIRIVDCTTKAKPPATLAQIKKAIAPMVSAWARKTDWNAWERQFGNGEICWFLKKGSCNWLRIRSDAKRHAFTFVCDNSSYFDAVVKFATEMEGTIKEMFHQVVPIEVERNWGTVTSSESSSTVFRGEEIEDGGDHDFF